MRIKIFFILMAVLLSADALRAQYYDWGQDPASTKWRRVKTDKNSFVFPASYERQAARLIDYMDTVYTHIGFGFEKGPMRMPLVIHSQNLQPNGIVMLAPKRMEFIVAPPADTYATPWLKQLATHEYRHSVQYNNMNRGLVRWLSYITGQQGILAGVLYMPIWAMEGDAVMAETEMSAFGRGLQPSFTIDYRAMSLEGGRRFRADKYFCGSFKDYMPDHYHVGYQINSYAYTKYGANVWAARRWKKRYDTNVGKLFTETFDDLDRHWRSLPQAENTSTVLPLPATSYTTYTSPVAAGGATVYALKSDLDRAQRIVEVDIRQGTERVLHKTGEVNTGLSYADSTLWWSELRQSTFWEQRVNSRVCYYDLHTGRTGVATPEARGREMFPVGLGRDRYACVEYDYEGRYAIKSGGRRVLELPDSVSVHGLAADGGERFYFIGLSDAGMWIGAAGGDEGQATDRECRGGFRMITPPSHTTIANLRAEGGRLYFTSIATGKDEAHCLDLATGHEYQISSSRYGSFAPAPTPDGRTAVMTTYTPQGYMLAVQEIEPRAQRVVHSDLPRNVVNPQRRKWEVMNIDAYSAPDTAAFAPKKYRKGLHLFQVHSWMPVYYEPERILSESDLSVHLGATILSQNLLNNTVSTFGYRYTDEGSLFRAGINYYGWAPKFELEAEAGTMDQGILGNVLYVGPRKKHYSITARAYLPILLSSGYHTRMLTPYAEFIHENHKVYYPQSGNLHDGYQKFRLSLSYTDNVRMAYRDFLPRWGYALRASVTANPMSSTIGEIWSAYGRMYLPGVAPHHSLMLRASVQYQDAGDFVLRQKELFPRGANYWIYPQKYASASVDYQLPVWYPDGGIPSLLYFKRIRLNLAADYARYKNFGRGAKWNDIFSYGLDITFDVVPIRLPSSTRTAVTIQIHKANNRNSPVISATVAMPI